MQKNSHKNPSCFHRAIKNQTCLLAEHTVKGSKMRIHTVNYWISQISAEKNDIKAKEPQNDKDLNFQLAQYLVNKTNNNQSKVA